MTERPEDIARVGGKIRPIIAVATRNMARRFTIPDIGNDSNFPSASVPLLVFGRERVVSQQPGLVSDFSSVLGQNTTTSITTREPIRDFGAINAVNEPNISSFQEEVKGKQVTCDCKTLCLRKGCPCKSQREFCSPDCTCTGTKKKPCQNRENPQAETARTRQSMEATAPQQTTVINVRDILATLPQNELLEIAVTVFEDRKSLLLDVMNQRANPGMPIQTGFEIQCPTWCKCGHCREMPTAKERKCCKRKSCLTTDQTFYEICLNGTTLEVAINSRCDIRVDVPTFDRKAMRHTAYRQFVMWKHGPLGAGNRVVIPSCCVWAIRVKYPSPDGRYTGYKDH